MNPVTLWSFYYYTCMNIDKVFLNTNLSDPGKILNVHFFENKTHQHNLNFYFTLNTFAIYIASLFQADKN